MMNILQIIPHMGVGGAQTTARILLDLPNSTVSLATFDEVTNFLADEWEWIIVHTWCYKRNTASMLKPPILPRHRHLAAFTHDWRGNMNFRAAINLCYTEFAKSNTIFDSPAHCTRAGIDPKLFLELPEREHSGEVTVGRLSTMYSGKISIQLIESWKLINATKFICAGYGSEFNIIRQQFSCDSRFEFPGEILPEHVPKLLHSIDIFLYDTEWHIESFCYVVLEAMAAGCVVICRRKGAIPELIRDGENGFLYDNVTDGVKLCNDLIKNVSTRMRVSKAARQYAIDLNHTVFLERVKKLLDDGNPNEDCHFHG